MLRWNCDDLRHTSELFLCVCTVVGFVIIIIVVFLFCFITVVVVVSSSFVYLYRVLHLSLFHCLLLLCLLHLISCLVIFSTACSSYFSSVSV